ncbi:TPA: hypothetical protein ACOP2N_004672 [Salmonella enterica]
MIPVDTQKLSYSAVVKQGITSPVLRNKYSQRSITRHIQSIHNSSNNILPDKVRNYGYTFVLSEQNISGDANKSIIELYKNKKKTLPDVLKLTTALIQKSNIPEVAFYLLENLKKSGITPNRINYNAYMHCLGNAGYPEQARKVLDDMRDKGLTPNVISYNTLMNAWANAGHPEQARKVLDDMRDKGLTPDVTSYSTLMNAWAKAGHPKKAREILDKMRDMGLTPDVISYNTLMNAWANAGHPEQAQKVLDDMRDKRLTPNVISYSTLMNAWANAGYPEQARKVLDEMRDRGLTPDVTSYSTLMNAWANAGHPEQAQKVLDDMRDKGLTPNVISYNTLMNAWANAGHPEQAQKVLDEMRDKGLTPDVISYSTLMNAWEKANIPEFATDNGYHNYILPLIKNATGDGVFGENVGYDKRKNVIDFHLSKLLLSSKEDGGTTAAWARAIVNFHYHEGNLESEPLLIVGRHGSGAVREAVLSELRALSDNYGEIFNYVVDPLNPGRLIVEKLVKKPVNNSV